MNLNLSTHAKTPEEMEMAGIPLKDTYNESDVNTLVFMVDDNAQYRAIVKGDEIHLSLLNTYMSEDDSIRSKQHLHGEMSSIIQAFTTMCRREGITNFYVSPELVSYIESQDKDVLTMPDDPETTAELMETSYQFMQIAQDLMHKGAVFKPRQQSEGIAASTLDRMQKLVTKSMGLKGIPSVSPNSR